MAITPPPDVALPPLPAPQRGDRNTFSDRVDGFVTWLSGAVAPLLGLASATYGNAQDAYNSAVTASAEAAKAAISAGSLAMSPNTNATSVPNSSINPADGSFDIIVEKGKSFWPGNSVKIALQSDPNKWFFGDVRNYVADSGLLQGSILRAQPADLSVAETINTVFVVSLSGPAYVDGPVGGVTVGTPSADVMLTAASGRLVAVSPTMAGLSVFLPDATTMLTGSDNQFEIDCLPQEGMAFDLAIRDSAGTLLGFAAASGRTRCNLVDNSTTAGTWTFVGMSSTGTTAFGSLLLSASVGGTGGTFIRAIDSGGGGTLIVVHGTSLHAVMYDDVSHGFGPPILLRAGLSTTGADGNVLIAQNNECALVASLQDGSTALQTVCLSLPNGGFSLTLSAVVSTVLPSAAARLASLDPFTNSWVLAYMVGTTAMHVVPISLDGTGKPSLGVEVANATVGASAVLPMADDGSGTSTFAVLTSTATLLTAKGYSITASALTAGTAVTTAVTGSGFVKACYQAAQRNWLVSFQSTTMKMSLLTMAGTVPAFGAPAAVSSIPTVTSFGFAPIGDAATGQGCIGVTTGTDASGRFVADFSQVDVTGALVGTTLRKTFLAAPAASYFGQNMTAGSVTLALYSAKETALYTFGTGQFSLLTESRSGALSSTLVMPAAPDANYPRNPLARNVIANYASGQAVTLGDGAKGSLINRGAGALAFVDRAALPVADMTLGTKGLDVSEAWVAYNQGPDTLALLQRVKIA